MWSCRLAGRVNPVNHGLMVHLEMAGDAPEVHALHIKLHGLLAQRDRGAMMLANRSVFGTTLTTLIPLTTRRIAARFTLMVRNPTFRPFHTNRIP